MKHVISEIVVDHTVVIEFREGSTLRTRSSHRAEAVRYPISGMGHKREEPFRRLMAVSGRRTEVCTSDDGGGWARVALEQLELSGVRFYRKKPAPHHSWPQDGEGTGEIDPGKDGGPASEA